MDQDPLAGYRAKIASYRPAVSNRLIADDVVVFDAGRRGFDIGQATASLKQGKVLILFINAVPTAGADQMRRPKLSAAETHRYNAYKSRSAAAQFLQGRGLLRDMLASYLGTASDQIEVSCREHVKPAAKCPAADLAIPHFNLSHSGGWIVLGADRDRDLGIDIECADRREIDTLSTMVDLFTPNERAHLASCLDQSMKAGLFFRLWRCKEAIMKATGRGFDLAPASFEVLIHDGTFKTIVQAEDQDWHLRQVTLCPGLDCAIAVGVR
jgi:4'-phosphopantetheinyl transferase